METPGCVFMFERDRDADRCLDIEITLAGRDGSCLSGTLSAAHGGQMRRIISFLASMLFGLVIPAFAGDKISYFACRADNDDKASVVGLDDTTREVCDRSVEGTWFSPSTFESTKVMWSDGLYTKAIYRTGEKRYEHDFLLLVHIGHCDKVEPTAFQKCNPP
jgi:hypothetical protein